MAQNRTLRFSLLAPSFLLLLGLLDCHQVEKSSMETGEETVEVGSRSFEFVYSTTVPSPPPGTRTLRIWIPLPLEDPGVQEVADLRTWVDGEPSRGRQTRDPVFGNRIFFLSVTNPSRETEIKWSAKITRYEDLGQGRLPNLPEFLAPNRLIPLDGEARELALTLGADRSELPLTDRVFRIYENVLDEMEYDKKVPGFGLGDFGRSLTVCKGNCTDFHARFIGTARAGEIPCRFTMGIPLKSAASGSYDSYHCWAHWFDLGSWRPVDISEADKIAAFDPEGARRFFGALDPDRIALTMGRDLVLEPPQAGPPLNYFVFPYVEADGVEVPMDEHRWEFKYANLQP